jgi:hypothetical protein
VSTVDYDMHRRNIEHVRALLVTAQRAANEAAREAGMFELSVSPAVGGFARSASRDLQHGIEIADGILAAINDKVGDPQADPGAPQARSIPDTPEENP